jgi:hypothetical protein
MVNREGDEPRTGNAQFTRVENFWNGSPRRNVNVVTARSVNAERCNTGCSCRSLPSLRSEKFSGHNPHRRGEFHLWIL